MINFTVFMGPSFAVALDRFRCHLHFEWFPVDSTSITASVDEVIFSLLLVMNNDFP